MWQGHWWAHSTPEDHIGYGVIWPGFKDCLALNILPMNISALPFLPWLGKATTLRNSTNRVKKWSFAEILNGYSFLQLTIHISHTLSPFQYHRISNRIRSGGNPALSHFPSPLSIIMSGKFLRANHAKRHVAILSRQRKLLKSSLPHFFIRFVALLHNVGATRGASSN